MDKPSVSVIIPLYNGALLVKRCLDSVFNQSGKFDLEVIIIDDGSTDNSIEIIENYPEKLTLIRQTNQGPASARNKGIDAATGKYLAFLDADDYWKPDFLNETVSFLEIHNDTVAVTVGQRHFTVGNKSYSVPQFLETDPEKINQALVLNDFFTFWGRYFHICTGSILIVTEIVKKTGGQRTELRITEDLEFWAYLATFGPIGFIPKVLFISDGIQVAKQIGWINKNRQRWASAPTVEKWEERIVKAISEKDKESYFIARGLIARNLCYSMIMSNRIQLARIECKKYRKNFPNEKVASLLKIGSRNRFLWIIISQLIYFREYVRSILLH